jgi:hypothetical protein
MPATHFAPDHHSEGVQRGGTSGLLVALAIGLDSRKFPVQILATTTWITALISLRIEVSD